MLQIAFFMNLMPFLRDTIFDRCVFAVLRTTLDHGRSTSGNAMALGMIRRLGWHIYYLWHNHRIGLSVRRVLQYILRMYVNYLFAHLDRKLEKLRLGLDNSLPSSLLWLRVQSLPTNWKKTTHLDYPRLTWRPSRLVVQQIMDVLTSLLDFSNVLLGWFLSTGRSY